MNHVKGQISIPSRPHTLNKEINYLELLEKKLSLSRYGRALRTTRPAYPWEK